GCAARAVRARAKEPPQRAAAGRDDRRAIPVAGRPHRSRSLHAHLTASVVGRYISSCDISHHDSVAAGRGQMKRIPGTAISIAFLMAMVPATGVLAHEDPGSATGHPF